MGKFDGILICTDLDGTLYRNDKSISAENREAIEYFKSEGGYFTFITGRMPYYSQTAYEAVRPNVPFGCVNGGGLYDGSVGRYVWTTELSSDALSLVGRVYEGFPNVGIQLCGFESTFFAKENDVTARFRRLANLPENPCDYRGFTVPMAKIIFCTAVEKELFAVEKALREHELGDRFDFIRSERTLFEILPKGVSKALALTKLAEYLSVDMSRTIAIGDYDNDASMLRAAGCGIAVSNASKAALDAADRVTVSNEDHAIAKVISDLSGGYLLESE